MSGFADRRRKRHESSESDDNVSDSLARQKSSRHELPHQRLRNNVTPQQIPHRTRHVEDTEQLHEKTRASTSAPFDSDAGTTDNLEARYIAIQLGEYEECSRFLNAHARRLKFSFNDLLPKAVEALRLGNKDYAERCVQQSLILRDWKISSRLEQQKFIKELSRPASRAAYDFENDFSRVLNAVQQQVASSIGPHSTREPPERDASASFRRDHVASGGRLTTGMSGTSAREASGNVIVEADTQSRHDYGAVPVAAALQTRSRTNVAPAVPAEVIGQSEVFHTSFPSRHERDQQLPGRGAPQPKLENSRIRDPRSSRTRPLAEGYQTAESTMRSNEFVADEQTYERLTLDSRYVVRKDRLKFGTVFGVLWHESAPGHDTSSSLMRRMVVVKESANFCWCIAINTYGGHGLKKMGMTRKEVDAHTIIHMDDRQPVRLSEEPRMSKQSIKVEADGPHQALAPSSRLNFAKVYTVESFNRVTIIGKVAPDSLRLLREYWKKQTETD